MTDDEFGMVAIGLPAAVLLARLGRDLDDWPSWSEMAASGNRAAVAFLILAALVVLVSRGL